MNAHHLSRSYHVRSTTYSMYYVFAHWSSHFIVHAGLCCSCLNRTRRASPFDLACPRVRCNAVQYSVNTYYVVSMFLFRPGTMDTSFFSGGAGKRKKTKKGGGDSLIRFPVRSRDFQGYIILFTRRVFLLQKQKGDTFIAQIPKAWVARWATLDYMVALPQKYRSVMMCINTLTSHLCLRLLASSPCPCTRYSFPRSKNKIQFADSASFGKYLHTPIRGSPRQNVWLLPNDES